MQGIVSITPIGNGTDVFRGFKPILSGGEKLKNGGRVQKMVKEPDPMRLPFTNKSTR